MLTKVKFFWKALDTDVQDWLSNRTDPIEIISTNLTSSDCGWAFYIVYRELLIVNSVREKTEIQQIAATLEQIQSTLSDIETKIGTGT